MKWIPGNLIILALFLASCSPGAPPSPAPTTPREVAPVPAEPGWKQEWENAAAAARTEGKITVVTRFPATVRESLASAFKEKYGVEIEYSVAAGTEFWPKIEAERRIGIYTRDVVMSGFTSLLTTLVPSGAAEPMEPAFILPEVKDPNAWRDKRLPFYDPEGKVFMFISRVGPTLLINTEMVKPEELKSWRNLLDPKWKGKILLDDPSIPGAGNGVTAAVSEIMGIDFLKELSKQDLTINRDRRQQVEWVARGKYPIGMGYEFTLMEEMRSAGAPLANVVPAEGTHFGSSVGAMAMFNRPGHPNATKVFVNWFLSREGQTLFARAAKEQSRRADVPSELAADRLFQDGIKYVDLDSEHMSRKKEEIFRLHKEIFAAQYK